MDPEVRHLQEDLRLLEKEAAEAWGGVHDPTLDTLTQDGRTLRQVIYDLSEHYREHIEQMLWAKWGQRIARSETKRALAELQGLRAQLGAYFAELKDEQLGVASAGANNQSPRDVVLHVVEEERRGMDLVRAALEARA